MMVATVYDDERLVEIAELQDKLFKIDSEGNQSDVLKKERESIVSKLRQLGFEIGT